MVTAIPVSMALMDDIREINKKTIDDFRAHEGGGPFEGRPLLLLTTRGRRTGRPHTTPMMYMRDGDRLVVFASAAGSPDHTDWYHNLVAEPKVTVEVGPEVYIAVATVTSGAERDRLWADAKKDYPFFADHEKSAVPREIPVIVLERI
jgi:deazaflavin-dependent oxidoreductase (nitroreductase family)